LHHYGKFEAADGIGQQIGKRMQNVTGHCQKIVLLCNGESTTATVAFEGAPSLGNGGYIKVNDQTVHS